jgi:hypothetical protein
MASNDDEPELGRADAASLYWHGFVFVSGWF